MHIVFNTQWLSESRLTIFQSTLPHLIPYNFVTSGQLSVTLLLPVKWTTIRSFYLPRYMAIHCTLQIYTRLPNWCVLYRYIGTLLSRPLQIQNCACFTCTIGIKSWRAINRTKQTDKSPRYFWKRILFLMVNNLFLIKNILTRIIFLTK